MRAITLWQPWASLVAEGIKHIETRPRQHPWRSAIGQTIAIHAGIERLGLFHLPPLWSRGGTHAEQEAANLETFLFMNAITAPEHQRPHRTDIRDRVPKWATSPTLMWPKVGPHARPETAKGHHHSEYLPLGAVVATCTLVDVVPMEEPVDAMLASEIGRPSLAVDEFLTLYDQKGAGRVGRAVNEQRPFGDFAPGRWALLLGDIRKCAPFPVRGHQGLWTLPDAVADNLMGWAA